MELVRGTVELIADKQRLAMFLAGGLVVFHGPTKPNPV
jgi:hypothetical protein